MKYILGKKIGMTQIFGERGRTLGVTLIEGGPCTITQMRTQEKDGYTAAQVGFGKRSSLTKALIGHLKGLGSFRYLRECRFDNLPEGWKKGETLTVGQFSLGDKVKVTSFMKGRGFQGGVKRHGFSGGQRSHGHRHVLRTIGSIGSSYPERVWKGKRMPGQYGNAQVSTKNLKVVSIDADAGILALHGAVPGANGSLVIVQTNL